ncbi:MAG: hypothetical protein Q7T50_03575 [Candidatus Magasanikbacteria bacterium]|nr:hypothetical protein [Candidatus Magasanikbacteria bacterium]
MISAEYIKEIIHAIGELADIPENHLSLADYGFNFDDLDDLIDSFEEILSEEFDKNSSSKRLEEELLLAQPLDKITIAEIIELVQSHCNNG